MPCFPLGTGKTSDRWAQHLLHLVAENRILVIRGGAIGDFILTLPVLSALREMFPETRIHLLGYPRIAELAVWGGLAQEVRAIEDRPVARFFAQRAELDPAYQEYFASFAVIVSYLFDPDGIFQENVQRCSKAQFIAGPHRPSDLSSLHATEVLLQPLQRLAIFGATNQPVLRPAHPHRTNGSTGSQLLELANWTSTSRPLALHPGSGSERKNWSTSRWRELLERLMNQTNRHVLLVGGEAEGDRLEKLKDGLSQDRVRTAQSIPLPHLAELLLNCERFVGHDSGISHLAAALDLPTLALWGLTAETVWKPLGPKVEVLKGPEG